METDEALTVPSLMVLSVPSRRRVVSSATAFPGATMRLTIRALDTAPMKYPAKRAQSPT